MPVASSDGKVYEDFTQYLIGNHAGQYDSETDVWQAKDEQNLSQSGVKQPLKVTITPHMQAGESEQGSPEGDADHKVFFVRHGKTPENDTNTIREKDAMLTDEGRQQSEQAAEKLKEEGVTHLFSSSLPRARESAEIIGNKLGITPQFDSRLNTWGMGTLEGQPCSEENLAKIKSHMAETPDKPLGGEESFNNFKDRTFAGIRDSILNGAPGKTAILTHSKVEDALERWKATGQDNPSLDLDSPMKEEKPGSVEPMTIEANSTIMQPATYSKQQFAGGYGPTPQGDTPASRYFEHAGEETWQSIKSLFDRNHPENLISPGHLQGGGAALGVFTGRLNSIMRTFAETAEKRGISPEAIKQFLGAERGAEGMWRKEISDLGAYVKIPKEAFYDFPNTATTGRVGIKPEKFIPNSITETLKKSGPFGNDEIVHRLPELRDIFEHPELYKAYPELANTPVERLSPYSLSYGVLSPRYQPDPESKTGLLKFAGGTIKLNIPALEASAAKRYTTTSEEIKSVLLHEIQHWIQHKEGFSRGQLKPDVKDEIGKIYEEHWKNNPEAFTQYMKNYNKLFGDKRPTDYNEYIKAGYDMAQEGQYAAYLTQANEVESRNVQARMRMSPDDIKTTLAKSTADTPYRYQIIPAEPQGVTGRIAQTRLGEDYNKPNVIPESSRTLSEAELNRNKAAALKVPKGDLRNDPEKMKSLETLLRQGRSFSEIAEELGQTRNAIAGVVKRTGLSRNKIMREPSKPRPFDPSLFE